MTGTNPERYVWPLRVLTKFRKCRAAFPHRPAPKQQTPERA